MICFLCLLLPYKLLGNEAIKKWFDLFHKYLEPVYFPRCPTSIFYCRPKPMRKTPWPTFLQRVFVYAKGALSMQIPIAVQTLKIYELLQSINFVTIYRFLLAAKYFRSIYFTVRKWKSGTGKWTKKKKKNKLSLKMFFYLRLQGK